jgi:hypothetical protein
MMLMAMATLARLHMFFFFHDGRARVTPNAELKAIECKVKVKPTSPASLPFLPTLRNLLFQFFGSFVVFLVSLVAQFADTQEEIIHVLGPLRGICDGTHGKRGSLRAWLMLGVLSNRRSNALVNEDTASRVRLRWPYEEKEGQSRV